MATVKLSIQDKKDLDKFTKFLALKAAQIIVQSRLGEKVHTKCKPHSSGTDWFNLAIRDLPEVLAEAKRALCGEVVTARLPLCVEISLRTVEGDTMMLETWCLGVLPEQCDPSVRVTYTVYNRMGILLKSLVSVTRVTPAYKLSRRQGPDSYVICYRIYMGEPQLHNLGEGYNQVRVGQLCTPVGTLHLSVSYRTKMTISPQHTGRDNSIMLKSDHFHSDLSPRHLRYQQSEDNSTSLSDTLKVGAFADTCRQTIKPLEPDLDIPSVPFSSLLTPQQSSPQSNTVQHSEPSGDSSTGNETEDDGNGNVTPRCHSSADSRRSSCSMVSTNEDFIMVDLVIVIGLTMALTNKRKCSANYPGQDNMVLLELIQHHKSVVENKATGVATWKEKERAWEFIAKEFNSQTATQRTSLQLRETYESLKKKARQANTNKVIYGPGVGKSPSPKSLPADEYLYSLMGSSVTGLQFICNSDLLDETTGEEIALPGGSAWNIPGT